MPIFEDTGAALVGVFSLVMTLACYFGAKYAYDKYKFWWLSPIMLAPLGIVSLVLLLDIPLTSYFQFSQLLTLMLTPAVIAFAVPIYRERHLIAKYPLTLSIGVLVGLFLGLLSSWGLSKLVSLPPELSQSVLVRFVSTPFAMEATSSFGGLPELTAMLVLLTGVLGMLICEPIFRMAKINTSLGKGAALGASAHGVGAAKASEIGEEEGVVASLTMIFTGIAMVIMAPLFSLFLV
ncbi:LrgB family protein [Shewanella violacea]|uniref:Membrane protein, putative n=1 Tax=Shewanella violacea (strain JCM 10179 / CIP 106290 / LMG 19151 / DSS12) TaxID=637905 RepID=D4ZGC3_SHEVD|nr:LrgB family protein [Shewanella violacea]BAJ00722.1 membrane protein, putative [Shewanella violacea DSS12]